MKLQICDPVITSHHFYALPLSIIGSDPKLKPWLYSEFIQIFTCRNREDEKVDIRLYNKDNEMFKYEPLHDAFIAPKRLVYGEQVIDVYKVLLDSEPYIYDFVDKYYIKSFGFSGHFIHDLLLYGYDDEEQAFFAYAYNGSKLSHFKIPYREYIEAYNSNYMQTRHHITVLYRKKNDEYHINIKKIGMYMMDYLNGINAFNRESLHKVNLYKSKFGLGIYDELKYILEYDLDHHLNINIPDIYCLYDHKRFMCERVESLQKASQLGCSPELVEKFYKIKQSGSILAMLSVKLNQTGLHNAEDMKAFIKRIDILREMEEETYTKYYEYNRSIFENV